MAATTITFDASPFREAAAPLPFISCRAQREAIAFLKQTVDADDGLGLLYGPPASGKRTVVRHFVDKLPGDLKAAVINGAGLDAEAFLHALTHEYGLDMEDVTINVLVNMLRVFSVQQTRAQRAPLVVIENLNAMKPDAVQVVCQLVKLKFQSQSALRVVIVAGSDLSHMMSAPGLGPIRARMTGEHALGPMTRAETAYYLDAKLRLAGFGRPEDLVPADLTDQWFEQSGGRPGLLDQLALAWLGRPEPETDVAPDPPPEHNRPGHLRALTELTDAQAGVTLPRLLITRNGITIAEVDVEAPRLLIGRAKDNDITIDSHVISRHHLLLTREDDDIVLTDLNSTNGTYVNSRRVFVHGLRHEDVISLGNHGIKLLDPERRPRSTPAEPCLSDTAEMRVLGDVRRAYVRDGLTGLQSTKSAG